MRSIALCMIAACVVSACSVRTETREVRPAPAPVVYAATPEPTRTVYVPPDQASPNRDEYGFRYDARGNRIDSRGNIISPQSTYRD